MSHLLLQSGQRAAFSTKHACPSRSSSSGTQRETSASAAKAISLEKPSLSRSSACSARRNPASMPRRRSVEIRARRGTVIRRIGFQREMIRSAMSPTRAYRRGRNVNLPAERIPTVSRPFRREATAAALRQHPAEPPRLRPRDERLSCRCRGHDGDRIARNHVGRHLEGRVSASSRNLHAFTLAQQHAAFPSFSRRRSARPGTSRRGRGPPLRRRRTSRSSSWREEHPQRPMHQPVVRVPDQRHKSFHGIASSLIRIVFLAETRRQPVRLYLAVKRFRSVSVRTMTQGVENHKDIRLFLPLFPICVIIRPIVSLSTRLLRGRHCKT